MFWLKRGENFAEKERMEEEKDLLENFLTEISWKTLFDISLVTQPISQLQPNRSELRSMDYYHQIFCRFRICKRKVPPPSPLSNDFEKS